MTNRAVTTVVIVVLVVTLTGFATIAAGEATTLQLSDRYTQPDQQCTVTAYATPV